MEWWHNVEWTESGTRQRKDIPESGTIGMVTNRGNSNIQSWIKIVICERTDFIERYTYWEQRMKVLELSYDTMEKNDQSWVWTKGLLYLGGHSNHWAIWSCVVELVLVIYQGRSLLCFTSSDQNQLKLVEFQSWSREPAKLVGNFSNFSNWIPLSFSDSDQFHWKESDQIPTGTKWNQSGIWLEIDIIY